MELGDKGWEMGDEGLELVPTQGGGSWETGGGRETYMVGDGREGDGRRYPLYTPSNIYHFA